MSRSFIGAGGVFGQRHVRHSEIRISRTEQSCIPQALGLPDTLNGRQCSLKILQSFFEFALTHQNLSDTKIAEGEVLGGELIAAVRLTQFGEDLSPSPMKLEC